MSALRSYPGRLLVMFQPHGFSPMRLMGRQIIESFAQTMTDEDILLMPEIYFAGGTVTRDISSNDLIKYAGELGRQALFFDNRRQAGDYLKTMPAPATASLSWAPATTRCRPSAKKF